MYFLTHVTETEKARAQRMVLETAPDAVMELAELQIACLTGEDICDTTIRIPRDMRAKGDRGGIVDPGIVANAPVRLADREAQTARLAG